MGKYTNNQNDIFSVFNSILWKAENLKTYPSNFVPKTSGNEYLTVSIIPSGNGINNKSTSGIVIIDIFVSAGEGPNRVSLIADILDNYLQGKSLSTVSHNVTQFDQSSLGRGVVDKDNPALYRTPYTIPFNYFGVL